MTLEKERVMSQVPPIACSLGGAEQSERYAEMAAVGRNSLLDVSAVGGRTVLRFRPGAGRAAQLEALVAAESRCCPFLRMELEDAPGAITLSIAPPPGADEVVDELVAAFSARTGVIG
jgi:MerR family copper efflux transcriptional regulator